MKKHIKICVVNILLANIILLIGGIYVGSSSEAQTPTKLLTVKKPGSNISIMDVWSDNRVGIGTSNPASTLEVAGTGITLGGVTRTTWPTGSGTGAFTDTGSLAYYTGGNVGIGLTSPGATLDIKGNLTTALTGTLTVPAASTGVIGSGTSFTTELTIGSAIKIGSEVFTIVSIADDTHLTLDTAHTAGALNATCFKGGNLLSMQNRAGVSRLVVNGDTGNVGIGTTGPGGKLHIESTGDILAILDSDSNNSGEDDNPRLELRQDGEIVIGGLGYVGTAGQIYANSTVNAMYLVNDSGTDLQLGTNNAARVTINNTGNVGIGTISPGVKLAVNGNVTIGSSSGGVNPKVELLVETTRQYGLESSTTGSVGYSVRGLASGVSSVGVYGLSTGGAGTGLYGKATSGFGVFGSGSAWSFYASGTGTDYGPFTGGHEVRLSNDFPVDIQTGMIVSVTGEARVRKNEDGAVSISSTLPTVTLSDKADDKAVFGVYDGKAYLDKEHWYNASESERFARVNALGEGRVWVSNINGDIEAGDYITTSDIPGYGHRQKDDLLHSYTLGKAIETIDWDSVTDTVDLNGQTHKVYLLAVVYTSG